MKSYTLKNYRLLSSLPALIVVCIFQAAFSLHIFSPGEKLPKLSQQINLQHTLPSHISAPADSFQVNYLSVSWIELKVEDPPLKHGRFSRAKSKRTD